MKKPLHGSNEQNLIWSKGRLIGWGVADVKNLLANGNRAKVENLKSKPVDTIRDAEHILTHEWLEIIEKGITPDVVKKLNSRLERVYYHHVLMLSPNGPPFWRRVANGDRIDDPEIGVAYGVAHLLALGALDGLKRCRMQSCQKFFIGPPNKESCSKKCGSHFRVKRKRKEDKKNNRESLF